MLSPSTAAVCCWLLLAAPWAGAGALTAEQLLDLQPGALQQYDAGTQLDADMGELEIEQLARYLQEEGIHRNRLHQQMLLKQRQQARQQQLREPEFSYSFPPAPPSTFALRPSDPGYYPFQGPADDTPPVSAPDGSLNVIDPVSEEGRPPASLSFRGAPEPPLPAPHPEAPAETDKVPATPPEVAAPPDDESDEPYHQQQVDVRTRPLPTPDDGSDLYFIAIVAGCSAAAIVGIIAIGISWYRLQKNAKAAADVEYPAYGVTGPNKEASPTGDRRLAQSAQMYHYQHQKQQIIAMESRTGANERPGSVSEAESEEDGEEGDYTVYECPGLAPTGEMEVKNPLFQDDPTPATPAPKTQEQPGDKQP